MKYLIFTFILFTSLITLCQDEEKIMVTTSIIIERDATDAKELGLIIEGTDYGFIFEFEDKYKSKGLFVNPNIYVYSEYIDLDKSYDILMKLSTIDTSLYISKNLFLSSDLSAVRINCFIGKNQSNLSVVKKVTIEKFINDTDSIEINMLDEPELMSSPKFNLVNNTSDTLYPAICLNTVREGEICAASFYGIIYKKGEGQGYFHHSPDGFCKTTDSIDQELLLPKHEVVSYTSSKNDCTPFKIKEKGYYLFSINVSPTSVIRDNNNQNLSNNSIFQVKTVYVLSHKFQVK